MAKESVFEKKHGEEDVLNDVGGLLEQFNLPPAFIEWVRKNKKILQITVGVIVVCVVFFSLYGSYRDRKIDQGAQALALATSQSSEMKMAALDRVANEFSSTSAGLWARVEIAHENVKANKLAEASALYDEIADEVGEKDPLYPLVLIGSAQVKEAEKNNKDALAIYEKLRNFTGYEGFGFAGIARVYEQEGNNDKALEIYELYLGELAEYPSTFPEKILVEEKIARIKSIM